MTGAGPAVSVVMAAYNGSAFIDATIRSVLAQTLSDFEIVVVDDGSIDDTLAVLAAIDDARLHVVRAERNGGPAVARSLALAHATGRFVAGLDQDDLCRPDRFARQVAYLEDRPDFVLVASTIERFAGGRTWPDPRPDLVDADEIDWLLQLLNPLAWSTVMMRGEVARALLPFERDEYRYAEDFDLYHRVRSHGRIGRIAAPLVRYRMHPGGASRAHVERMTFAAAQVLADAYRPVFGDHAEEAALLVTRHGAGGEAPGDAPTLRRCGEVIERLLAARFSRVPDFATAASAELWWRMARCGLRAGSFGMGDVIRVCPPFALGRRAAPSTAMFDTVIGASRRLRQRARPPHAEGTPGAR